MISLLHTADWQIGRIFSQFDEDDAAALFEARFKVIERLASIAHERRADAAWPVRRFQNKRFQVSYWL